MQYTGYPLKTMEDVETLTRYLECKGIPCEWSGLNVWVSAPLSDAAERGLEKLGARWSRKRSAWYFRAVEGVAA